MIIKKDSDIVKGKSEKVRSVALKARKESSDEESSNSDSEGEEYALAVRDIKKFFRRKGRFVRQPRDEKKSFSKNRDDKKEKNDRKCFRCGDPNHLIGDCPKPPRNNYQRALVGGSWSDSDDNEEKKPNDETCLMAQASNEVHSDSFYYSDDNSSINDNMLYEEYNKLCEVSSKIITRNKILKTTLHKLEKEIMELKDQVKRLDKQKVCDVGCESCHNLRVENVQFRKNALKIINFEKEASKSQTKQVEFSKPTSSVETV